MEVGSVQRLCPSYHGIAAWCGLVWHIAPPTGSRPAQSTAPDWSGHLPASPITSQSHCLTLLHLQAPLLGELPPSCSYATSSRLPTHDQLDSPPLNDTTTSYCLPTLPIRPYDTSGVSLLVLGNVEFSSPYPPSAFF